MFSLPRHSGVLLNPIQEEHGRAPTLPSPLPSTHFDFARCSPEIVASITNSSSDHSSFRAEDSPGRRTSHSQGHGQNTNSGEKQNLAHNPCQEVNLVHNPCQEVNLVPICSSPEIDTASQVSSSCLKRVSRISTSPSLLKTTLSTTALGNTLVINNKFRAATLPAPLKRSPQILGATLKNVEKSSSQREHLSQSCSPLINVCGRHTQQGLFGRHTGQSSPTPIHRHNASMSKRSIPLPVEINHNMKSLLGRNTSEDSDATSTSAELRGGPEGLRVLVGKKRNKSGLSYSKRREKETFEREADFSVNKFNRRNQVLTDRSSHDACDNWEVLEF